MLHLPLVTLKRRLWTLYTESESECVSEAVSLALRCWHVATRTLALVSAGCVETEHLASLATPQPEEVTGLLEVWRSVNVAYDLLCT